jgi:lipoprotein-anchoring transpeptidase ErfK/SrfK
MMKTLTTSTRLQLGIEAARGSLPGVAGQHFSAILKEEPDNIAALLWLASVSPNPHESLRLLNRVLTLDPTNEGAKSGLDWARQRMGATQGKPAVDAAVQHPRPTSRPVVTSTSPSKARPVRSRANKARKKSSISRIRYTYRVGLAILIMGLLGVTIGLGASIFIPTETLAAWLPAVTAEPELVVIAADPPAQPIPPPVKGPQAVVAKSLKSTSDTIPLARRQPAEDEFSTLDLSNQNIPATVSSTLLLPNEENLLLPEATSVPSIDPSLLIGPSLPLDPSPVDPSQLAHQPAYPDEKWIEVNVTTQQVTAWEGNLPVLSFISSTGLPNTPTVVGEYNIYWKLEKTLMTGPGYYLPDVPHTMYFYLGYALHGTYWHDNFGQPMSRGCVNLSTDNAKKLFDWADPVIPPGQTQVTASHDNPGTLVVVHQ